MAQSMPPPVSPPPPAAPYPPPMGPPPYAPPPKGGLTTVLLIVVAIVVAVIVIAAVWWAVFLNVNLPSTRPTVTLSTPTITGGGAAQFSVTGVTYGFPGASYRVNLEVDSVLGTSEWLSASTTVTVGTTDYTVNWQDVDGLATLNVGDRFVVNVPGGLPAGAYRFLLLWADGTTVGQTAWTVTATMPVVAFGNPSTSGGITTIPVAGVSQALPHDNFRVNLRANSTTGTAVALATAGTASNVVVGGTTYTITWIDIGGEATVNAGDSFQITTSGGLPAASSFVFYLLWSDGSLIQSASWATA